jgi:hypothetical protein
MQGNESLPLGINLGTAKEERKRNDESRDIGLSKYRER